jgi:hypothetical protein
MGWLQRRRERIFDERAAQAARTKGDVDSRIANHEAPLEPLVKWNRTEAFHAEVAAHAVTRWKLRQAEARIDEQDRRIFTLLGDLSAARAEREGS